jgi:hypothetical protein
MCSQSPWGQVCENHLVKIAKSKPTLNDLYQALKDASAIETETWRFIQFLADIQIRATTTARGSLPRQTCPR